MSTAAAAAAAKRRRSVPNMADVVQTSKEKKKRLFSREIALMMYAFGDSPNPRPDSCEIVEELVMEYITELVHSFATKPLPRAFNPCTLQCMAASQAAHNRDRVKVEDILFALRKDQPKLDRAEELLFRFDELAKARKAFDATSGEF